MSVQAENNAQEHLLEHCPLCQSDAIQQQFIGVDRMHGYEGKFPVYKCQQCQLMFLGLKLSPKTLAGFYPETYYSFQGKNTAETQRSFLKTWELKLREDSEHEALHRYLSYPKTRKSSVLTKLNASIKKKKYLQYPAYRPNGKLLDVGCGGGLFLSKMRELGWQVQGIEPGHNGVEACKQQGLDVVEGFLEQANFHDQSFDFIRFEHVLEHVPDPVSTLIEAKRILKKDGYIRLLLPNWNSLPAQLFRTYWYHLDTPRHLFWFTNDTIQQTAEHAGLLIQKTWVTVDYSDIADSLSYYLKDRVPFLGKRMDKGKTLWKLCNKLSFPLRLWMKYRGTGTLLHVELRHPVSGE